MQLSKFQAAQVIALYKEKIPQNTIAKKFNVNQSTISRIIKRYQKYGKYEHSGGNGRKKLIDASVGSLIFREIYFDPKKSLRKLKNIIKEKAGKIISKDTIKRYHNERKLFAFSPIKKPLLKKIHIENRKKCALEWMKLTDSQLKSIIFSDESKFNLMYSDGKTKVWREHGKGLENKNLCPTIKHGGGSVMVWGCFSYFGVGKLVFIEGKMDSAEYINILSSNLQPSADKMSLKEFILQQDNDPKHTSKLSKQFYETMNYNLLPWPAQSPDMNPIENLWNLIKVNVGRKNPKNLQDLKTFILIELNKISKETCEKYSISFRKRTVELLRVKGNHTKY